MKEKLKFVDLFSGCGGFSQGLIDAGYQHVLSIERSPMAAETYYRNIIAKQPVSTSEWLEFLGNKTLQLEKGLFVGNVQDFKENKEYLDHLKNEDITLVVGGPPCQGFSMVGKRNPEDKRNDCPIHFAELVEEIKPKAFVMENVLGITLDFKMHKKKTPLDFVCSYFERDYLIVRTQLNACNYGVPQYRPRIYIIGLRNDIASKLNIQQTDLDIEYKDKIWVSDFIDKISVGIPTLVPIPILSNKKVIVEDALADIGDSGYTHSSSEYSLKIRNGNNTILNHVLRKHNQTTSSRFQLYHILMSIINDANTVNNVMEKNDLEIFDSIKFNIDSAIKLKDGTCIENERQLINAINKLSTKKHSQAILDKYNVSSTIMTIPDDYVHFGSPRVLTVREMARLQSFPDNFEFMSKETTGGKRRKEEVPQYTQVGNAVPPILAKAIGCHLRNLLIQDGIVSK